MGVGARAARPWAVPAALAVALTTGARADSARLADSLRGNAQRPEPAAPARLATGQVTSDPAEDAARSALERGLDWLAARQAQTGDGSFPAASGNQNVPVPVAALAALAFMAGGSSPERGPHGKALVEAIDYLLARADLVPGSPTPGYIASEGDSQSRMHGHAFATLALAQAWSMSPRTPRGRRIEEVLRTATALIEHSQGLEGGWFYEPRSSFEHENSVTVVLVQALRAARGAGVSVDAGVIERAVDYIRRCQMEDGSFRYALTSGETSIALTAAGLTTLHSAGVYQGSEIDRAVEALWRRLGYREDRGEAGERKFPFYERFYLAQALWQLADARLFQRWVQGERARVLAAQRPDGSWRDPQFGDCYATAMNCLFLAIPEGLLPIFQR